MYLNSDLSTTAPADTYYTSEFGSGYIVNSSGAITTIL